MARKKGERNLGCILKSNLFVPNDIQNPEVINLLSDEVEAIYLMDLLELYQEDAAKKMGVSRPTFARIIKNARRKIALALINAKAIELQSQNENKIVAFCSNSETNFVDLGIKNKIICIFKIHKNHIIEKIFIHNPVFQTDEKPAISLTNIFVEHGVNQFITPEIGEGFRSALISKGINVKLGNKFDFNDI